MILWYNSAVCEKFFSQYIGSISGSSDQFRTPRRPTHQRSKTKQSTPKTPYADLQPHGMKNIMK